MQRFILLLALFFASGLHAEEKIIVFAAASLTNALSEISTQFERNTGIKVQHSFAASSTLAKQIDHAAPADVFVSADIQWMDYLASKGKIDQTSRKTLLNNKLVMIAPKGQAFALEWNTRFDIAKAFSGRICTGEIESVPVGIYAKQALLNLGWWNALKSRLVGTQDVRSALSFVERGECMGIVYLTDAKISAKVDLVGVFPDQLHSPIEYPVALVKRNAASTQYLRYLQSDEAKAVFTQYGFEALTK